MSIAPIDQLRARLEITRLAGLDHRSQLPEFVAGALALRDAVTAWVEHRDANTEDALYEAWASLCELEEQR